MGRLQSLLKDYPEIMKSPPSNKGIHEAFQIWFFNAKQCGTCRVEHLSGNWAAKMRRLWNTSVQANQHLRVRMWKANSQSISSATDIHLIPRYSQTCDGHSEQHSSMGQHKSRYCDKGRLPSSAAKIGLSSSPNVLCTAELSESFHFTFKASAFEADGSPDIVSSAACKTKGWNLLERYRRKSWARMPWGALFNAGVYVLDSGALLLDGNGKQSTMRRSPGCPSNIRADIAL